MKPPGHAVVMNAIAAPVEVGTDPKEIVELLKRRSGRRITTEHTN